MNERRLYGPVPPELSPEYDHYVEIAVDLANNRLSPERAAEVRERMRTDEIFRKVVEPIVESYKAPPLSDAEMAVHWKEFRRRAGLPPEPVEQNSLGDFEARVRSRKSNDWRKWGMVAAGFFLLLLVPLGVIGYQDFANHTSREAEANEYSSVRLPDASTVLLSPGSRVRYNKSLEGRARRIVTLTGEATFTVTPLANQPFEVHTNLARVIAVGTRFSVTTSSSFTLVYVSEGKVTVQAMEDDIAKGRLLTLKAGTRVRVTKAGIIDDAQMTQPFTGGVKP